MKNLIVVAFSLLTVTVVSGQTLAKKKHLNVSNTTDQMSVPAFLNYVNEVEKRLILNEQQISDLTFFVINLQSTLSQKVVNKVSELQGEMKELKTDLQNFKEYGLGDWHLFQAEFNDDLKTVSLELDYMHNALVKDYLLASN
jgi:hypothetical protein